MDFKRNIYFDESINNTVLESNNSFFVYKNYLNAIQKYLKKSAFLKDEFIRIASENSFKKISGSKGLDTVKIAQYVRNSWLTEIQMDMASSNDEFIPFSNHWLAVQAYYAMYLQIRSLSLCMKNASGRDHASTLKFIGNLIRERNSLFPHPFNIYVIGGGSGHLEFGNLPKNISVNSDFSVLTSNPNFYDSYAKFLKTTRDKVVLSKGENWKRKNVKKRLPNGFTNERYSELSPTTIFDCTCRLRVRANYEDADSFLLTEVSIDSAKEYNESFRLLTKCILMSLELLICRHLGKNEYKKIFSVGNLKENRDFQRLGLKRWEFINSLY